MHPEVHGWVSGVLDSMLLFGILLTALLSIFKAGRWFGGIVDSINHLSTSMDSFKLAFDQHTRDEDARFISVELKMTEHSKRISELRDEVKKLRTVTDGIAGPG